MEIILSKQCEALTGSLGKGYGYYIRRATDKNGYVRFFSQRSKHPPIPYDGHLRFIFACAELAQLKTHITDIRVSAKEFRQAAKDADRWYGDELVKAKPSHIYNASDVLRFKRKWNL